MKNITFPRPLKKGDKIAICSPAGYIAKEKVEGAVRQVAPAGAGKPVVMPLTRLAAGGTTAALPKSATPTWLRH